VSAAPSARSAVTVTVAVMMAAKAVAKTAAVKAVAKATKPSRQLRVRHLQVDPEWSVIARRSDVPCSKVC
jgi:hypothetical protein